MSSVLTVVNPNKMTANTRYKLIAIADKHSEDIYIGGVIFGGICLIVAIVFGFIPGFNRTTFSALGLAFFDAMLLGVFALTNKTDKNTIRMRYSGNFGELYYTLVSEIQEVRNDCRAFKETIAEDDFLKDSIVRVEMAAGKLEWDIACYWRKIKPYLSKGTKVTKDRVEAMFKEYRLQVEEFKQTIANLTDTAFKYSVVEKSKNHLEIIQTDIKIMIEALEEAYSQSQLMLNTGIKTG